MPHALEGPTETIDKQDPEELTAPLSLAMWVSLSSFSPTGIFRAWQQSVCAMLRGQSMLACVITEDRATPSIEIKRLQRRLG